MSHSGLKRLPDVPLQGSTIIQAATKADLLEVAWDLASLLNDAGSADDAESTAKKLIEMINVRRKARGAAPLSII